tara:strand:+ start:4283 stop:5803 length:1521 start_codon:yes stop_codon:yes gene_type:complete
MIMVGDSLERLKELPENSVDSIVTDPPYGLSFMGKKWDYDVPSRELWAQCLRVLKPGGHLIAFAGSRTYHRLAINVEDAGFEIRDQIMWIYGSGFPKSLNISKAIDKAAGAERVDLGPNPNDREQNSAIDFNGKGNDSRITAPATDDAKKWEGWGTALKPAHEPCVLARKPISENNIPNNVLKHDTGAINIDDCRIKAGEDHAKNTNRKSVKGHWGESEGTETEAHENGRFPANVILDGEAGEMLDEQSGTSRSSDAVRKNKQEGEKLTMVGKIHGEGGSETHGFNDQGGASRFFLNVEKESPSGRYPANVIHDGSDEVRDEFPDTKHSSAVNMHHEEYIPNNKNEVYGEGMGGGAHPGFDDVDTSAARFFYCAKASRKEREAGLEDFESAQVTDRKDTTGVGSDNPRNRGNKLRKNIHPTVKPVALMRYLCRLVTPPGGKILDPFLGSGTTGIAALLEGFDFIGCEISQEYADIATARMAHWSEADLVETDMGTSLELPPEAEWL